MIVDIDTRAYVNERVQAAEQHILARIVAVEEKAVAANEWRGAMNDRERNFAREPEISRRLEALSDRIATLERAKANLDGRMAVFLLVPTLIGVAGLIVAVTK